MPTPTPHSPETPQHKIQPIETILSESKQAEANLLESIRTDHQVEDVAEKGNSAIAIAEEEPDLRTRALRTLRMEIA